MTAVLTPVSIMQRQEGNEKLSHFRAWKAMRTIDWPMDRRSHQQAIARN